MTLKAIRQAWVKALLSGDYKQDQSYLKTDDGYCCLGVLCNLEGVEWSEETKGGERGYMHGRYREAEGISDEMQDKYQLNSPQAQLNDTIYWVDGEWVRELSAVDSEIMSYSSYDSLAEANDDGRSFTDIAELITDYPDLVWADEA